MRIQLSEHFTYGKLLRFTFPSIIMMIFTSIYSVVDGIFVSNFAGKTPFAAINLIMPLLIVSGAPGFMVGTGGSAIVAKTMGQGKPELAKRYFSFLVCAAAVGGAAVDLIVDGLDNALNQANNKINAIQNELNSTIDGITRPTGRVVGELADLCDDVDDLVDLIDSAEDVSAALRQSSEKLRSILDDVDALRNLLNEYEPTLQESVANVGTLSTSAAAALRDLETLMADTEALMKTSGNQLDDGTRQALRGLSATLRQTAKAMAATGDVRDAKATINTIIEDTWNEYTGDVNNILLMDAGAEPVFFSPLRDEGVPEGACGLYLPGGYPELYAQALSENTSMRERVRQAVTAGLPTVAECGGFLYLQEALEGEQGKLWPMAGALLGAGYRTNCLQGFGYKSLTADGDSLLLRAGESVPVHEFHYWDSTVPGTVLSETMYAGFPHLHFGGVLPLAERFVAGVVRWRKEHG